MIERDYQIAAHKSIYDYFRENSGFPLLALPTGTGKSVVIAKFVQGVLQQFPGQKIIIATHVKELIEQNLDKLLTVWPTCPAGIYSAGLKRRDTQYPAIFAGIASIAKRASEFGKVDLLIIDEAHLVSDKQTTMYRLFIDALLEINPQLKVIGLTATAYRLGLGCLTNGNLFTDICFDLTTKQGFSWLVEQGYLSPLVPKRPWMEYDLSGVKLSGGEFVQKQLQSAVDKERLTYEAVRETIALGQNRRYWLVFAAGVEHAIHVRDAFDSFGVPAAVIHSKCTDEERAEALAGHRSGRYRVIVNNNVLTTGYDFPDIDLIAVLRPTKSPGLHVQMLGRGTRPVYAPGFDLTTKRGRLQAIAAGPKQNCLVLDFAGNTRRLGPVNDPLLPKPKGEGGGGVAPVKVCEKCNTYNHASARFCEECGEEFPRVLKIQGTAYTDEILETSLPEVEPFKVDRVTYQKHEKRGGQHATLQVTYFCGLRMFKEWVCLEHSGYAGRKAMDWWRERSDVPPPDDINLALNHLKSLRVPKQIHVWLKRKYPEVMSYDF